MLNSTETGVDKSVTLFLTTLLPFKSMALDFD
jgi:hypothetical protein